MINNYIVFIVTKFISLTYFKAEVSMGKFVMKFISFVILSCNYN